MSFTKIKSPRESPSEIKLQNTKIFYSFVNISCYNSGESCKLFERSRKNSSKSPDSPIKHIEQIRLKLTDKYLILQKELQEAQTKPNDDESVANVPNEILKLTKDLSNLAMSEAENLKTNTHTFQHLQFANSIINYENNEEIRVVKLKRHPLFGLGLCVKGGKEHGLPLLISNMFKNQPAELSEALKVGDAILKVNEIDVSQLTHEQAVNILKTTNASMNFILSPRQSANSISNSSAASRSHSQATNELMNSFTSCNDLNNNFSRNNSTSQLPSDYDVVLTVKNYSKLLESFRIVNGNNNPLGSLINQSQRDTETNACLVKRNSTSSSKSSSCASQELTEANWLDLINIPLELACVSEYVPGTDRFRETCFEVYSKHGISSGILVCENEQKKQELIERVNQNIQICTQKYISSINQNFVASAQVSFLCWVNERIHSEENWSCWNRMFLVLKGSDCYLFENCDLPKSVNDWNKSAKCYRIYESLFKLIKANEQLDERSNCFVLHNCNGSAHYMNVENIEILIQLDKMWQRTLYTSVYAIGSKSFNCVFETRICVLFIDIHKGFILMDNKTNETLWSYQFAQLKTSTDDNNSRVKFFFQDPLTKRIEIKSLECKELYCLLYVIHSFLTAKLTSADLSSIK